MKKRLARLRGQADRLRLHLANPEALVLLSLFALLTGLLTGLLIVLFHWLLEGAQSYLLPSEKAGDFESLPSWMHFALPVAGGLLLAVVFHYVSKEKSQLGVLHVIERMHYHQGYLPSSNMIMQFVGALIALASGHSVGREGPCVHMGSYSGSWLSQRFRLPNNSTRTLIACGTAAAIGASFNTPLAGMIFAMEVILQHYTVQGFIPVMLAAVSGTYVSKALLDKVLFFNFDLQVINTTNEWPLIIILGVCIGILSATFNFILIQITRWSSARKVWWRFVCAGLGMGLIGWWVPQTLGIGYDSLDLVVNGKIGIELLLYLFLAKMLATLICAGLGIPGGVIGPLMFMGGITGGIIVILVYSSNIGLLIPLEPSLYPLLGMGAMFAASLQAPLAGLTAVMELAGNTAIILPAMLAVVSASITSKLIFHHDSLFKQLLQARGLDHSNNPVMQRLRTIGAASTMNRSFIACANTLARNTAMLLLARDQEWLLVTDNERKPQYMLRSLDAKNFLETHPDIETLTLADLPGKRLQLAPLSVRASLQEALDQFEKTGYEALYLRHDHNNTIYGILTRAHVEKSWL